MAELSCPRCGTKVAELQSLDPVVIQKIRESGKEANVPQQVCGNCFTQLAGSIARGSILLAHEKAKEQRKMQLWKSRVNLIKNARKCMAQKAFSEAAVQYEKYLRVLEMVFDVKAGELKPEQFKDSARTQELTVVASAYWDLIRIYDTGEQWADRQTLAAMKLAQFLRFTPIYPDIMKKAEVFQKSARNPNAVKQFIKMASENKGRCFVATAAFENPWSPEVLFLQDYRDQVLLHKPGGQLFVDFYYWISPPIAELLDKVPFFKPPLRFGLRKLVQLLRASFDNSKASTESE